MPLQSQNVSLPIVGGLNEKDDALISMRPQEMTNCMYRKTGAVSKRYGYDCIGLYNLRSDATTPSAGEHLTTFGDELLRVGGGRLDSYSVIGTTSEWAARGRVPECVVQADGVGVGNIVNGTFADPAIAYANGYIVVAYLVDDGSDSKILCDVIDATTGARAYSRHVIVAGGSSGYFSNPRVVATGTSAFISWGYTVPGIGGVWLNLSTMTFGTVAAIIVTTITSAATQIYDIDIVSSSEVAVIYEKLSGTNRIGILSITNTITAGLFDQVHGPVFLNTTDTNLNSMSIRFVAGERIWVAYSPVSGDVRVGTLTTAFALGTTPFNVEGGLTLGAAFALSIERLSSTTAIVSWTDGPTLSTYWNEVTSAGVVSYSPPRSLVKARQFTRPFVRSGRVYTLIMNVHATHGTQFIIDLSAGESMPANGSTRIVSVILPRQLSPYSDVTPRSGSVANWVSTATDEWTTVSLVAGASATSFGVVTLRARFDTAWKRTSASTSKLLVLGGGSVTGYDGSQPFELGFAYEPDVNGITVSPAAGGSMTLLIRYNYKFVYAWVDAQGNVHRSKPSLPVACTLTGANASTSGTVPPLHLTNKDAASGVSNLVIEIYRTTTTLGVANSTYQYVKSIRNVPGSANIAFTDNAADTTIQSNAVLYTDGGVLDHLIPAGGSTVMAWKSGLLVGGTDDDSIWVSGEILAGEGPWFEDTLSIAPYDGGRIAALAQLDATLVAFKANSIALVDGEPPNDLGASSLTSPRRVQADVGCSDAASVVQTSDGVAFKASTGLYLLNRGLSVIPIGKGVEDSCRASGFAGAAVLPAQGLVRWLQKGTSGYDTLSLDAYHSGVYGGSVWSKDVLYDVKGSAAASPVACTMWRGAFVWLSAAGYLYQESSTNFADVAGATSRWVTMTFETGFEKPGGASLFQRVWRVHVLGNQVSPHGFAVTLTTDVGTETRTWTPTEVSAFGGLPAEKYMVHVAGQKCQWMKVKVADSTPASAYGTYAGMTLRDITLQLGVKPGTARVASANKK